MHPIGFLRLSSFLFVWVGSCFYVPTSICLAFYGVYTPVMILCGYFAFRLFFPGKVWFGFKEFMRMNVPGKTYCNSQTVVLERGVKCPEPCSKTMMCVAPHGILTVGFTCMVSETKWEPAMTRWLVTDMLFYFPFIRDIFQWSDIHGINAEAMKSMMDKSENIGLIPGGFEEATFFKRGHNRVYIKKRKGFIKYALKYGYKIHPCFCFGEEWTYWQWAPSFLAPLRLWLNSLKIPATFFVGKWLFILPDNDIDMTVVVGRSFDLPHIPNPSKDDVDKWHARYINELQGVFDRNKHKYCRKDAPESLTLELL